jgi:hypothetical protein
LIAKFLLSSFPVVTAEFSYTMITRSNAWLIEEVASRGRVEAQA